MNIYLVLCVHIRIRISFSILFFLHIFCIFSFFRFLPHFFFFHLPLSFRWENLKYRHKSDGWIKNASPLKIFNNGLSSQGFIFLLFFTIINIMVVSSSRHYQCKSIPFKFDSMKNTVQLKNCLLIDSVSLFYTLRCVCVVCIYYYYCCVCCPPLLAEMNHISKYVYL